MVSSNQLKPGEALPSVRELAVTHVVNPIPISKAYSLLEAECLLESQRGNAMTVAAHPAHEESKAARFERLQPSVDQLVMAARQLELGPDDIIKRISQSLEKTDE